MIDDKKIEEAANLHRFKLIASMHGSTLGTPMQCFEEEVDAETDLIENSFITGAKWAVNELLKDLWHPASEVPKRAKNLLLETTYEYGKPIYHHIKYMPNGNDACIWREWYKGAHVSRWLYIEDLLPKEGGEQ
jgi:hypothetical protein